jgi:hypothetical protein
VTTAICLPAYLPPSPEVLRLIDKLRDLNGWLLLESREERSKCFDDLLRRAESASVELLVWLHPKIYIEDLEHIDMLIRDLEATGANSVAGIVTPWESAIRGAWSQNMWPASDQKRIVVAGDSSGVVECDRCSLDFAVTTLLSRDVSADLPRDQALTQQGACFADTRVVAGMIVEAPFFPHMGRNVERS